MKKIAILTLVVGSLALTGCNATTMGTKQTVGTLGGGALGGLAGAQFGKGQGQLIATGAGVLLGAFLGNEIGSSLDKADEAYADTAFNNASNAPIGQRINWNNPQTGNSGYVQPIRDGYDSYTNSYCREYSTTVIIGGRPQQGTGTACRQLDGTWKVIQ